MRIAIACDDKGRPDHFGHCATFEIYGTEDGRARKEASVPNPGHRPGYLPLFLRDQGVGAVVAGSMGEHARAIFAHNGIETYLVEGIGTDEAADRLAKGTLVSNAAPCAGHGDEHGHGHEHGHG